VDHPADTCNEIRYELAFLADILADSHFKSLNLSEEGTQGLYFLIRNMEAALRTAVEQDWPEWCNRNDGEG
jgi:hypothetical protein